MSRIPDGLGELKTLLEVHIHNRGMDAVEQCGGDAANDPKTYVNTILDVHRKYNCLVLSAFNNDAGELVEVVMIVGNNLLPMFLNSYERRARMSGAI